MSSFFYFLSTLAECQREDLEASVIVSLSTNVPKKIFLSLEEEEERITLIAFESKMLGSWKHKGCLKAAL